MVSGDRGGDVEEDVAAREETPDERAADGGSDGGVVNNAVGGDVARVCATGSGAECVGGGVVYCGSGSGGGG